MGCVYCATNIINGKMYVGKTMQPLNLRISAHKKDKRSNSCIHKAIQKYGPESFLWRELHKSDDEAELFAFESKWIKALNTTAPHGYNLSLGGEGSVGYRHTEKAKEKIRKTSKGRRHSRGTIEKIRLLKTGLTHSLATKEKLSAANKGKKLSHESIEKMRMSRVGRHPTEETRKKLSLAQMGNKKNLGKKLSDETKKKIGDAHRGRKHTVETRNMMSLVRAGKKGRPCSEETKNKISIANSGKRKPPGALAKAWATRRAELRRNENEKHRLVA